MHRLDGFTLSDIRGESFTGKLAFLTVNECFYEIVNEWSSYISLQQEFIQKSWLLGLHDIQLTLDLAKTEQKKPSQSRSRLN